MIDTLRLYLRKTLLLLWLAGLCFLAFWSCSTLPERGELLLSPDTKRQGKDGQPGPYGVGLASWFLQSRVSEGIYTDVLFPATQEGTLDRTKAPYPCILFVHGGLVPAKRYRWLAKHFASRGYVVLMPSHLGNLALLEYHNVWLSLRSLREKATSSTSNLLSGAIEAKGKSVVMGHSLGGVVSSWLWVERPEITGIAMLASWPSDGTNVAARKGSPVLSIIGSNELKESRDKAIEQSKSFQEPRILGFVKDMNHYDWTDGTTPEELEIDGPASSDLPKARRHVFRLLDLWLDATLLESKSAKDSLAKKSFEGIDLQ